MPVVSRPWLIVKMLKNEKTVKLTQFIKVAWFDLLFFSFTPETAQRLLKLRAEGSLHGYKMLLRDENGEDRDSLRRCSYLSCVASPYALAEGVYVRNV